MSGAAIVSLDLFDYRAAVKLWQSDPPFYALVAAAMQRADTTNAAKLRAAFPDVWDELQARYDAPGGVLDSDSDEIKINVWGSTQNPRTS